MNEELQKAEERLLENTKAYLRNWPNVGYGADGGATGSKEATFDKILSMGKELNRKATVLGYDMADGKDHTVVSINFNGVVVGPGDKLVLTLRKGYDRSDAYREELLAALRDCGIDRERVVVCTGVDAAVVKPLSVIEGLGSAGPWCDTTQRAVEREGLVRDETGDKVNDPLPTPPGYCVKTERVHNTCQLHVSYDKDVLEQLAAQSVGKPFKDQKGNVLGTVERAWVEDGKVLQSIAWGKVPDGACVKVKDQPTGPGNATVVTKEEWNNLLSWCDPAAKAQTDRIEGLVLNEPPVPVVETGFHFTRRKTPDNVERLTLDQPTDLKVQAYDSDTGAITVGRDPPEPSPSRPCGYCNGKGYLPKVCGSGGLPMSDPKCPVCGGSGNR